MTNRLQDTLRISQAQLDEINALLLDPESKVVRAFLDVVRKYGTPEEINRKAAEARCLETLIARLREMDSPYVADLNCAQAIRSRERLVVMDALLACYDGGPSYKPATTAQFGQLWFSMDPLAIDVVAQEAIEGLRREEGLPTLAAEDREPSYIAEAGKQGRAIGCGDRDAIVVVGVEYWKG